MAVSPDPRELAGLMEAAEHAKFRFTGDITFLAYEDATHKYLGCRGCLVGAVAFLQGIRPTTMKPDTFDFAKQIGLSVPVFAGLSDGYDKVASGRNDRWMLTAWLSDSDLQAADLLPPDEYAAYQEAFAAAVVAVETYVSAGGSIAESEACSSSEPSPVWALENAQAMGRADRPAMWSFGEDTAPMAHAMTAAVPHHRATRALRTMVLAR